MFKIKFPDGKNFTGIYLSTSFRDGEGETDSEYLAEKFKSKGLTVEKVKSPKTAKPQKTSKEDGKGDEAEAEKFPNETE